MFTPNYKRLLFESALALKILESKDYELMYLDEFSIQLRNKSVYGWGPKGDYGFQQIHTEDFNMSFIIGFSIRRIYGVLGTTATHSHKSFITFISNILDYRVNRFEEVDSRLVIVCDNASIHKSKEVKEFLNKTEVQIMTIWPYSPALNPAEKMILFIRKKIQLLRNKGR